jgi:starch synthase (maltosyl-transferring)
MMAEKEADPKILKGYLSRSNVVVERVEPEIDSGRFRAKAIEGDDFEVSADIIRDGPALLQAVLRYRGPNSRTWSESFMTHADNDRWVGSFRPNDIGTWRYTIEAWTDHFGTWRRDMFKRVEAGQTLDLELEEGALLLEAHLRTVPVKKRAVVQRAIETIRKKPRKKVAAGLSDPRIAVALSDDLAEVMAAYHLRANSTMYKPVLELTVDAERARFGAWYEFFPRSTGNEGEHGTFQTAMKHLTYVADLGFDVVYLPPIHPIGSTNRKGKNNSLTLEPGDVGSPWAIGSKEGGHKDIDPALGTIEDFDAFVTEAERLGIDVALDYAIQCSPDHPWVTEYPEWFHHRPDGTIKYAENPPKRYQDIYPVNFDTEDKEELWLELKSVLDHWISHGVKIFRVDNPHTKAFPFWEWLIEELKTEHPDLIFLAEAFTRPKVMQELAKLGFTQSYTYFTWRNSRWELEEYLTELTRTEMRHYFRPNLFANTPDILHEYLQRGGPPAFKIRLALAAFLSPTYGIYSGYEFFENVAVAEGSEEYLNSEKYELRNRRADGRDNLIRYIRRINEIRKENAPLAQPALDFHATDKENLIAFSKTAEGSAPILVVVNLNPFQWEEGMVSLNHAALGLDDDGSIRVTDLIEGDSYVWTGAQSYVRLDPFHQPAHVFRVERA